jgi:hypothetical protein
MSVKFASTPRFEETSISSAAEEALKTPALFMMAATLGVARLCAQIDQLNA